MLEYRRNLISIDLLADWLGYGGSYSMMGLRGTLVDSAF